MYVKANKDTLYICNKPPKLPRLNCFGKRIDAKYCNKWNEVRLVDGSRVRYEQLADAYEKRQRQPHKVAQYKRADLVSDVNCDDSYKRKHERD